MSNVGQLVLSREKPFRKQRDVASGSRGSEIRYRAREALVDEDGDRRGSRAGERARQEGRIGVGTQLAGRRRAALHLGDRAEPGLGECVSEPTHQATASARVKAISSSR